MPVVSRWSLALVNRIMPDTATILRYPTATSGPGGWSQDYEAVATTRCLFLGLPAPSEQTAGAELASLARWKLVVPNGTDIQPSDRIQINGKTLEVAGGFSQDTWTIVDTYYLEEVRR